MEVSKQVKYETVILTKQIKIIDASPEQKIYNLPIYRRQQRNALLLCANNNNRITDGTTVACHVCARVCVQHK